MKEKPIKLPSSMAACADLLFKTRRDRLKLQKAVDKLQAQETALNDLFIEKLPKDTTGIAGKQARVQVTSKPIPVVENWDKFYAFVKKSKNGFSFMQRRVNEGAVKEVWEAKKEVPGVGKFNVKKVSCTAL